MLFSTTMRRTMLLTALVGSLLSVGVANADVYGARHVVVVRAHAHRVYAAARVVVRPFVVRVGVHRPRVLTVAPDGRVVRPRPMVAPHPQPHPPPKFDESIDPLL